MPRWAGKVIRIRRKVNSRIDGKSGQSWNTNDCEVSLYDWLKLGEE